MKKENKNYTAKYFQSFEDASYKSAEQIVPALIKIFKPKSVVDVGCGTGSWLKVFKDAGIKEVLGIDGDYVEKESLMIKNSEFKKMDLSNSKPIKKRFDLAVTVEVAEHLKEKAADQFVTFLTDLSNIVVFSAAAPRQQGTMHHNEQWPEYWQKKFANKHYVMLDMLRFSILSNENIADWYKQNIFVCVSEKLYQKHYKQFPVYNPNFLLVHKNLLNSYRDPVRISKIVVRKLLRIY